MRKTGQFDGIRGMIRSANDHHTAGWNEAVHAIADRLDERGEEVRALLKREGATYPFWTTQAGPVGQPIIHIVCQDLKMLHALDDFLKACVRDFIKDGSPVET